MADENQKNDSAVVPETPSPAPETAKPASKVAKTDPAPESTKPADETAKPAKASKPKTVTVINTSGLKFRLGWEIEDELSLLLPGENEGVDADLFDAWVKRHEDSDLVKNGAITKK